MMIDASGCNGGGGPKKEVMEAELVLSLISAGGRKRFDSSGEPLGGRISDGTSDGKDDRRPDHRRPESERLDRGERPSVAEDPSVVIAVGGEKGILREGNADSEEVGVEANGGGAAGDANERSGEQTLENGRGHREEGAAAVAMDAATAENYIVGNGSGETLESRPWGHVEVVEVKVSVDAQGEENELLSEDGTEAERQNGDCNRIQEARRVEKGDAIEAETNFGREPLNCQEQLVRATEPPTESERVVSHAEEAESLNFVRQVNDLQEAEPRGVQQSYAIAEVAPVAQSEEKPDPETNLIVMSTSENAFTEQAEIRSGDMNVSSNKFNTGRMNVPDTDLQGHSDAETGSGNPDVAMAIDVGRMAKDISDVHDEKSCPELEDFSGAHSEPSSADVHSSADASDKDGSEVESRCPESEHSYSRSSISSVAQYYHGNQFIKFGEIIANLDEAHNPKRGPFFIIRVPRFTGDELWAKIQQAQDEVDEKTNSRDLINKEVQRQKAICLRVLGELATAGFTELATREAFEAKLAELTYVASTITMLSTSHSLEEIDTQIKEMEFNHQHVTGPLKDEKKYMQELKKLKCLREDMSSLMASKNNDKALKDEDSIDQKLKDLKKELDSLRSDLAQAEAKAIVARKKYDDEDKILQNIRKQFNAANEIRQDAFSHLQHLKKESFEKNRYFHNYKNDQMTARLYASSGNKGGLWLHCSSQVEEVMNTWNNNDNFRKQYVDCNKNSVLRRSKTLDARSLGPDEKPTVPSVMNKVLSTTVPTKVSLPKTLKAKELPPATQKGQPAKMRKSNVAVTKATRDSSAALVPATELIENTEKEKSVTKEEEELARKEEEVRKEKEAAELKERLKLEQRVKAKEAEERKKKQAEKAQARAEYRAQKEAELKEKKRSKKEKKKKDGSDDKEVVVKTRESNAAETFQEQQPEASSSRRNAWSTVAANKFNSVQPVPLLLRNRRRRKIATWTWVTLTAMLVILLFLALPVCFCLYL